MFCVAHCSVGAASHAFGILRFSCGVFVFACTLTHCRVGSSSMGCGKGLFSVVCFFFLSDGGGEATVWETLVIRRAE